MLLLQSTFFKIKYLIINELLDMSRLRNETSACKSAGDPALCFRLQEEMD